MGANSAPMLFVKKEEHRFSRSLKACTNNDKESTFNYPCKLIMCCYGGKTVFLEIPQTVKNDILPSSGFSCEAVKMVHHSNEVGRMNQ